MCGIAGYVTAGGHEPADAGILDAMCGRMTHRGPNDQGVLVDGPAGLGMRRLSVIDLESGHQPMSNQTCPERSRGAGDVWVVFNGEIYNYRELGAWLAGRGHVLRTASDTEVIVHLYEEFGEACVERLRGMFAFAVWDRPRGRLFLARDRLGVKPLYYAWDGRTLVFGSELKALLAHPAVEPELDPHGLFYYLRYSYIPDPLTIFRDVAKLPPGHRLTLTGEGLGRHLRVESYWDGAAAPAGAGEPVSETEAVAELERRLCESVRLRLVSDVPIGAFLSGGVDSSTVVACMARELSRPVVTFSVGFEEEAYNELPYARQVARHLGTDHHELVLGPQHCDVIERIVAHFDEPFADPSAIPTYHLSALAARHVTVVLSGDGGDELFAGYDRYGVELARSRFEGLPPALRRVLLRASDRLPDDALGKRWLRNVTLSPRQRYLETISYLGPGRLTGLLDPAVQASVIRDAGASRIMLRHLDRVRDRPWLTQLQYLDSLTYLPGDVLTKVDRMSMAHSLEAREPLLDHPLVEYVAGLPPAMKRRRGVSKYLLKRVAERLLPADIVHRRKQGFGVPLELWFRKDRLREFGRDLLFDGRARARGIFRPSAVEALVEAYERGRPDSVSVLWMLVVFEVWCRLYLDARAPEPAVAGV